MKKDRRKDFLEELRRIPNVSSVCEKVGLSRNTIYRWKDEDSNFKRKMNGAMKMGVISINDLAEGQLINAIRRGEPWATKYWLDNHKRIYMRPRPKDFLSKLGNKIDSIEIKIVEPKSDKENQKEIDEIERKLRLETLNPEDATDKLSDHQPS